MMSSETHPPLIASTSTLPTWPLYWSVRRELWENRSIYVAPLAAASVVLLGFAISVIGLPHRRRALLLLEPAKQRALVEMPYDIAAMALILTALLVGVFYCLEALHGERRDRSILFWKSLPVSDLTSVLAKLSIPLVVLPLLTFAIIEVTQVIMLLMSSAILLPSGLSATTWVRVPFFQRSVILLYGLVTMALWQAPFYGWLLLVSGWARRATFLWAFLPWIAVCMLEKIAFNTERFATMLGGRLTGSFETAFVAASLDGFPHLAPLKFLGSPGLWIGLAFAAAFFGGAVRLRRSRGPL